MSNNNSFVKGAVVLVAANFIVKLIGLIYKIPLTNLIGAYGMNFFNSAYEVYLMLIAFSTAGLPIAVSKMVSESHALGRYSEINKIIKAALISFGTIGLLSTFLMFFGAQGFADMINSPLTVYSIAALAPAVVFFSVVAILRGYFQGLQNMKPTAITQVCEALTKVSVGILLAVITLNLGLGVEIVSAAAIFGIVISVLVACVMLICIYNSKTNKEKIAQFKALGGQERDNKKIIKDLIIIAIPVTLGAFVVNLTGFLDLFLIKNRLADIGYTIIEADTLYGAYRSYAHTVYNLPISIMATVNVTIVPVIASAFALKDFARLEEIINKAIKVIIILALPCAVGLFVLPGQILSLLFPSQPQDIIMATPLLRMLSTAVVFTGLSSMLTSILQATGKVNLPIVSVFFGGLVKLTFNYILIGNPNIGINGGPISTNLCYITILTMNLFFIKKHTNAKIAFKTSVVKPVISALLMGVIAYLSYDILNKFAPNSISLVVTIVLSGLSYCVLILVTGAIDDTDFDFIPGGNKLKKLMKKHDKNN